MGQNLGRFVYLPPITRVRKMNSGQWLMLCSKCGKYSYSFSHQRSINKAVMHVQTMHMAR